MVRKYFVQQLGLLLMVSVVIILTNIIGYKMPVGDSIIGVLLLSAISLVGLTISNFMSRFVKLPSMIYVSLLGLLLACPVSPVKDIVVETTTPENKIATRPFVLNVTGDDVDGEVKGDGQGQPLEDLVIAVDRPITALIRIKKLDSNSHKMVLKAGAGYVIHDTDGAWFNYYTAEMTSAEKKAYKDKYGEVVVELFRCENCK